MKIAPLIKINGFISIRLNLHIQENQKRSARKQHKKWWNFDWISQVENNFVSLTRWHLKKINFHSRILQITKLAVFSEYRSKKQICATLKYNLELIKCNVSEFLSRFVTECQIWRHHYLPECNIIYIPLICCTHRTSSKTTENTTVVWWEFSQHLVIWNSHIIIFIRYLGHRKTSHKNIALRYWTDWASGSMLGQIVWQKNFQII